MGTLIGFATLFLADALAEVEGHIATIDIRHEKRTWSDGQEIENVHEVAERLVEDAGLSDRVTFLEGHSNDVLATLIDEGRVFDFALIDGSHSFPTALLDFIAVDRMLIDGGFVALDDVGALIAAKTELAGGPNRLLEVVFSTGRYEITPISRNVAICQKRRSVE